MPPVDPIAPVVSALSVLVKPNPVPPTTAPYPPPSTWEANSATNGTLYTPIQTLLGILVSVSSDMNTVGKGVNAALTDVAKVVTTIADNLNSVGNLSDVNSAMTALQNSLSLAQALAPGSTTAVLNSASGLFEQLQNLLSSVGSIDQAAAELAEFSQQLTALAKLFPS
jgi:prophage DNA circulation protein